MHRSNLNKNSMTRACVNESIIECRRNERSAQISDEAAVAS